MSGAPSASALPSLPGAWLVPISGPPLPILELAARPAGLTLGRHEQCDVRLPPDAERVSRMHARFRCQAGVWRVADLQSRWGTFVNGIRLSPGREVPLGDGDLVRITPWTFGFRTSRAESAGLRGPRATDSFDDVGQMQTLVRSIAPAGTGLLAEDLLGLLLESAAGIHATENEAALAAVVLEAAIRGTGLANAAWLRPLGEGRLEVVASRLSPGMEGSMLYSRSLLAAAANGLVVEIGGENDPYPAARAGVAESVVRMQIQSAICVPLVLGGSEAAGASRSPAASATVAGFLYLDSRSPGGGLSRVPSLRANASAFCLALGRMAALALANLKRLDMERRQALVEAELAAAAESQRWILPPRQGSLGPFRYVGESRPGRYVGGDFFDVIRLDDSRLAVALGDVSGHGIGASVLMTATQGFLHAALRDPVGGDIAGRLTRAVMDLNGYVHPRRPESKFVTLWVGVFDAATGRLTYVDAGHGYALRGRPGTTFEPLADTGGFPIGIEPGAVYESRTVPLGKGECVVVISDGLVEQFDLTGPGAAERGRQFGLGGIKRVLAELEAGQDAVAVLFSEVTRHAGGNALSDDATALVIRSD